MDKKLQDHVWSILPKEFKEEVKELYDSIIKMMDIRPSVSQIYANKLTTLEGIFGQDNLTSDAEGEEMLTVSRKEIQQLVAANDKLIKKHPGRDSIEAIQAKTVSTILNRLFGSKCMPDARNVASNVVSTEPKPAEPKFKRGDKAKIVGGNPEFIGKVVEIEAVDSKGTIVVYLPNAGHSTYKKDYLEPYTEQAAKSPKEPANTFASDEPKATESDDFDRIVNDGFREHNRLHIAAMAMQGILSNSTLVKASIETHKVQGGDNDLYKCVAKAACDQADALIAECEKGGQE